MIRKMVLMAMLCALAALSLASAASATTVEGGGTALAANSVIGTTGVTTGGDGITGSATLVNDQGFGNIVCSTGGFEGTLTGANPATTVTGDLNTLLFSTCTSWFGVQNCHSSSGQVKATGGATPTINIVTEVTCSAAFGVQCVYSTGTGGVTGTVNNANHEVTYNNVVITTTGTNTSTCGSTGHFTATFGPVEVLGNSNVATGTKVTVT